MDYIITNNQDFFKKIGDYNYCKLKDLDLPDIVAVDTETTSLIPWYGHMFSVQIGTGEDNFIVDLQQLGGELKFEQLVPYLKGKQLLFHNAAFDLGWFYKHNFVPEKVHDSMLASMIIHNGKSTERHSFKAVMERELGVVYDKTEQANIHVTKLSTAPAIEYAFNDVDRLLECMSVLASQLRDYDMVKAYNIHARYVRALAYMQVCGLPVSEELWDEKMEGDKVALAENKQIVVDYLYDNFPEYRDPQMDMFKEDKKVHLNLRSNKQMIPVFQKMEINIQHDKDPDKLTLNKDILKRSGHPFVPLWLDYQEADHDITTYGVNLKKKIKDGFFFTSFNPIKDTARISTRRGEVNILNFPANKRTRQCFTAKKGWKMIVADYEGQENAVLADQSLDKTMVASINEGLDLHCAFARLIFPELADLSDDEIKEHHADKRQFAKAPRFAKAYGGSGFTIAKNLNVSEVRGNEISDLFDELHSGVMEWGKKVLEKAIDDGYIESADGFKLWLPFYDEFLEAAEWMKDKNKTFWKQYRKGKEIYLDIQEKKKDEEVVFDWDLYQAKMSLDDELDLKTYVNTKDKIGDYFRRVGVYSRLCLNNPIQARSAFQTKRAAVMLFDKIVEEDALWKVKICNIPHDEFVLMSEEGIADKWARILEDCMITAGNYYMVSGEVSMKAEAKVGDSWAEAK